MFRRRQKTPSPQQALKSANGSLSGTAGTTQPGQSAQGQGGGSAAGSSRSAGGGQTAQPASDNWKQLYIDYVNSLGDDWYYNIFTSIPTGFPSCTFRVKASISEQKFSPFRAERLSLKAFLHLHRGHLLKGSSFVLRRTYGLLLRSGLPFTGRLICQNI